MRGIVAGFVGTSYMTAAQELFGSSDPSGDEVRSWDAASAPAQVGRKALRLVGLDPPVTWIPFLTHAMHWSYGTGCGLAYTAIRGNKSRGTISEAFVVGGLVWAASYLQLVPLGVYEPPWKYPAKTLATDVGYHLAFGVGTVTAATAT